MAASYQRRGGGGEHQARGMASGEASAAAKTAISGKRGIGSGMTAQHGGSGMAINRRRGASVKQHGINVSGTGAWRGARSGSGVAANGSINLPTPHTLQDAWTYERATLRA
jgi:hypothetical protein